MIPDSDALTPLCVAIDGLSRALQSGDPKAVLEAEPPLAAAAQALASMVPAVGASFDREQLRRRVRQARAGLARCRALGGSVAALTAAMSVSPAGYGRAGAMVTIRHAMSSVHTRT